ncbi:hypothetical protein EVAR_66783_1 [Eumeta japonica]|uniref:Uncharacterized protein n=1 Tax=Eumeta variegata TaxID=151549 RepID=A0A4C1ZLU2_EUMVA|nr:hypothetical protein EVAR_66783_1 [Eumeta japonica]
MNDCSGYEVTTPGPGLCNIPEYYLASYNARTSKSDRKLSEMGSGGPSSTVLSHKRRNNAGAGARVHYEIASSFLMTFLFFQFSAPEAECDIVYVRYLRWADATLKTLADRLRSLAPHLKLLRRNIARASSENSSRWGGSSVRRPRATFRVFDFVSREELIPARDVDELFRDLHIDRYVLVFSTPHFVRERASPCSSARASMSWFHAIPIASHKLFVHKRPAKYCILFWSRERPWAAVVAFLFVVRILDCPLISHNGQTDKHIYQIADYMFTYEVERLTRESITEKPKTNQLAVYTQKTNKSRPALAGRAVAAGGGHYSKEGGEQGSVASPKAQLTIRAALCARNNERKSKQKTWMRVRFGGYNGS